MQCFTGQLWDGDHVLFEQVTLGLDQDSATLSEGATGVLEIHEGGILVGPGLRADQCYRFILEDGQEWPVRLAKVEASDSAGIARMDFRVEVISEPPAGHSKNASGAG
jgi:hypothetical protein